jgi:hypothetical protein
MYLFVLHIEDSRAENSEHKPILKKISLSSDLSSVFQASVFQAKYTLREVGITIVCCS